MWLGEGVEKIREIFTWALKQAPSMLIVDEVDGVAPQRSEVNMHTDERRQLNERTEARAEPIPQPPSYRDKWRRRW